MAAEILTFCTTTWRTTTSSDGRGSPVRDGNPRPGRRGSSANWCRPGSIPALRVRKKLALAVLVGFRTGVRHVRGEVGARGRKALAGRGRFRASIAESSPYVVLLLLAALIANAVLSIKCIRARVDLRQHR